MEYNGRTEFLNPICRRAFQEFSESITLPIGYFQVSETDDKRPRILIRRVEHNRDTIEKIEKIFLDYLPSIHTSRGWISIAIDSRQ